MITRRFALPGGIAVAAIVVLSGIATARQDRTSPAPAAGPAATADLPGWMAGNWVAEEADGRSEEQRLAPAAETMVGMCRSSRGGKLGMYEFMVMEREAGSVVMWMRHYRWNMKEREQGAIRWALTKSTDSEAVFESSPDERFKNLIYRKTGTDTMSTSLVPRDPAGMKPIEFSFRRTATGSGKP